MEWEVRGLGEHVAVAGFDYQVFGEFEGKMLPKWIFECGVGMFLGGESAWFSAGGEDGGL